MSTAKNAIFDGAIQAWGNSLGLRITQPVGRLAHLSKGTHVTIEVVKEGLLIKPKKITKNKISLPFTEEQLIQGLTPEKAHADELPVPLEHELGDK